MCARSATRCVPRVNRSPTLSATPTFVWQWGQFLDHDITETPLIDPAEPFDIQVPAGDPEFDPLATGNQQILFDRSFYIYDADGVRQQVNFITAYIDGSVVYGSDAERQAALRTLDGTGRLKVTPTIVGDLLPYNEDGLPNAGGNSATLFVAGDVRANEQVGLTAMHTLFRTGAQLAGERFPAASTRGPMATLSTRWLEP